ALSCAEALIIVLFGGVFISLAFGIPAGLAVGFLGGLLTNLQTASLSSWSALILYAGPMTGLIIGLAFGLPASAQSRLAEKSLLNLLFGISLGLVSGVIIGLTFGFTCGLAGGVILESLGWPTNGS